MSTDIYCIDVECVASGNTHEDFIPVSVAIVNHNCDLIYEQLITPSAPVYDYLTPLTGITSIDLSKTKSLTQVVTEIRQLLPKTAKLIGQGICNDIEWLGLVEGVDFNSKEDISSLTACYNPKFRNTSVFSLDLAYSVVFGTSMRGSGIHLASEDAKATMKFYKHWKQLTQSQIASYNYQMIGTKPKPSFAKQHNYKYNGICLAGYMPQYCTCGKKPKSKH